jgi:integrase/recombinase XerC
VRDYAVRDFRRHLMVDQKAATATVESYVSAIGTLYEYLGLGRPNVRRAPKEQSSPKSLSDDELRAVLRAAERRGARDFAIAMTIFSCGPRVESVHKLNTDDLFLSDRMGRLEVRYGKGGEATTHPVPADARDALRRWLAVRREQGAPELGPLFTARGGGRLSVRRMQSLMGDLARESGKDVRLTPHVLRHTFARKFLESGGDVGQLQRLLGHKHLSSTQVYTNVRTDQLDAAVEGVRIDL